MLASDSLATLSEPISRKINVDGKCPKCEESIQLKDVQFPPFSVPSSSFPYAQKLFSIRDALGLTCYGAAYLNNRSMFSHITDLSAKLAPPTDGEDYVDAVKDEVLKYFDNQISLECKKTGLDLALQPDDWFPFGFQVAGFVKDANGEPATKVYWIRMGKKSNAQIVASPAFCTGESDRRKHALAWRNFDSERLGIFLARCHRLCKVSNTHDGGLSEILRKMADCWR